MPFYKERKNIVKMNKKQKGDAAERDVHKILLSQGYNTIKAPRTMKRIWVKGRIIWVSQANDFYGLFDHIAKKRTDGSLLTLWIQTKSNSCDVYKTKKEIEEFEKEFCGINELCQIWLRVKRKGFVIYYQNSIIDGWDKDFVDLKGNPCEPYKIT